MGKTLFFIYIIASIGFSSCLSSQSPQEHLIGKWHLISTSGGMTGKGFPVKKKTVIEFTPDCQYKTYEQDTLKYVRTYHLLKFVEKHNRRDNTNLLQIGTNSFVKHEILFNKNKLILREPHVDGFTFVYIRVPSSIAVK